MPYLVRHGGSMLSRGLRGQDGKAQFERRRGPTCHCTTRAPAFRRKGALQGPRDGEATSES
eukprot:2832340-Prorocentrum_lima.AAC.1